MAEKNAEFAGGGIQCDAEGCDFNDMTVDVQDLKVIKEWVNKPCPKCGANLLTREDYDATKQLLESVAVVNSIPNIEELSKALGISVDKKRARFQSDGKGGIKFDIMEKK